ncbi:MAG: efflux RND transporter periplasmic adaptor subunit [Polyangiaceae bacterium]|jgi:RND family efflux transporter MFP subunit
MQPESVAQIIESEGDVGFSAEPYRPTRRRLVVVLAGVALALGLLIAVGVVPRVLARAAADREWVQAAAEVPKIATTTPVRDRAERTLTLPGSLQPVQETTVYARTNGYVRRFLVDIGDTVKAGQVLAEIDAPEVDQELSQARAAANQAGAVLEQAQTRRELARIEMKRYARLAPSGVVSQQETEEHQATLDSEQANVRAAEASRMSAAANVRRLQDLQRFSVVTAPFDGTITSRTTEVGQRVTSGLGAGEALFKVAKVDTMRVFVDVPQRYAASVRVGAPAVVTLREFPGRSFEGKITRTANELDPSTRTLLTEVRVDNASRTLIAGMYATIGWQAERAGTPLLVPATALMVTADGPRVAVVSHGSIHWKRVEIESDEGDQIAVSTGLDESDAVVLRPSDRVVEGMRIEAVPAAGKF